MPKRALTSYLYFANAVRNVIKAEQPELSHKSVLSVIGERWQGLSETDRIPYLDMQRKDKIRYET